MSLTADTMELREEDIAKHYDAAVAMLDGFDHTPRGSPRPGRDAPKERSSGIGTRRRFRTTTPGLVTRSTARPEGVHLIDRISLRRMVTTRWSPLQATVMHNLRRALAIALAVGENYAEATGLADLSAAPIWPDLCPPTARPSSRN